MEVFIYADGGSRGNPGIAGAGAVVIDANTKQTLAELVYAFDKPATNNVAEYRGLIEGLRHAVNVGADTAHVFMDSKLVVEQMSGRWKIKHPDMQALALQARELAEQFNNVTYTWIPRAQNTAADKLSNDAMDASAAGAAEGLVNNEQKSKPASWSGTQERPTKVIFLRHGQTARSAEKKYAGHEDVELTEFGRNQALAAARALASIENVAAIISSPLKRCTSTAKEVADALGLEFITERSFIECDFGSFDGLSFEQAHEQDPTAHDRWLSDPSLAPPGGESFAQVYRRVNDAVGEIVDKHRGKTVIIVTHVNPIKSALGYALGNETLIFSRTFLDVASISRIDYYKDGAFAPAVVRGVNDISHLANLSA